MVVYMCSSLFQWTLDSRDLSEFMLLQAEQIPKMTTVFHSRSWLKKLSFGEFTQLVTTARDLRVN